MPRFLPAAALPFGSSGASTNSLPLPSSSSTSASSSSSSSGTTTGVVSLRGAGGLRTAEVDMRGVGLIAGALGLTFGANTEGTGCGGAGAGGRGLGGGAGAAVEAEGLGGTRMVSLGPGAAWAGGRLTLVASTRTRNIRGWYAPRSATTTPVRALARDAREDKKKRGVRSASARVI